MDTAPALNQRHRHEHRPRHRTLTATSSPCEYRAPPARLSPSPWRGEDAALAHATPRRLGRRFDRLWIFGDRLGGTPICRLFAQVLQDEAWRSDRVRACPTHSSRRGGRSADPASSRIRPLPTCNAVHPTRAARRATSTARGRHNLFGAASVASDAIKDDAEHGTRHLRLYGTPPETVAQVNGRDGSSTPGRVIVASGQRTGLPTIASRSKLQVTSGTAALGCDPDGRSALDGWSHEPRVK